MSDFFQHLNDMSPERRNYVLRGLTTHLEASGDSSKLHRLLREHECIEETILNTPHRRKLLRRVFTRQSSLKQTKRVNSWFFLQEQERESAAFIADVTRAWKLAEDDAVVEIGRAQKARSIGFATRYALILSSINDMGSGIAPALVARLIEAGIWTLTQGRTYAEQVPALNRRALCFVGVASKTSGSIKHEILEQALNTVLAIKDAIKRTDALVNLTPHLCRSLLQQSLAAAREITYETSRAKALIGIVPYLPEYKRVEVVQEALSIIKEMDDQDTRANALSSLIAYIPEPERKETMCQILAMVRALPYDMSKPELITKLAPCLPESLLPVAFDLSREIQTEYDRGNALVALASRLAQLGRQHEAMQLVRTEAGICSGHSLAQALSMMAPHLNEEQLAEVLKVVSKLYMAEARAESVVELAPYLSERLFKRALRIVESMKHSIHQIEPLAALMGKFPDANESKHLEQVLVTAMREYESHAARSEALERMASNIPDEMLPLVLSESRRIDDEKRQVKVLAAMATVLRHEEKTRVSNCARLKAEGIHSTRDRFEALAYLTPLLVETSSVEEALSVALSIEHPDHCACGLTGIFRHLTQAVTDQVMLDLMNRWRKTRHEEMLPKAFNQLAPYLSDAVWQKAISFAQEKEWLSCRGGILSSLVRNAENAERLRLVLPLALEITDPVSRAAILIESARQLAQLVSPEEALELVGGIPDEMNRVDALEAIIPYLPGPLLPQVLASAEELTFEGRRWAVLASVAPRFAALGEWNVAVKMMVSIKAYHQHSLAASRMVEYAPDYDRQRLLTHAMTIVQNAQRELEESEDWWQGETLRRLVPHLTAAKLEDALDLTLNIKDPEIRGGVLSAVTTKWLRLKPTDAYRLWQKCLHRSSDFSRVDLLENLLSLVPVLNNLGGPETVADIVDAVNDVGEWWPA